ncbi:sigma-70 family RNA polymerase sigma factor [Streptacidiphilus sp. EB129]|uniref:sigma-70 family RNA polymerase sigma factor n=1 Tax=Streptacidiphilus sp. EB129 TaxID=3156262 RepID=UPI0035134382
MRVEVGSGAEWVAAAQAGDAGARERLIADHLPLVYNIVGRAMSGHPDVDDVVQETMIRVIGGLDRLREPASFRSWLVAVAMNEVRRRWSARRDAPVPGLDEMMAEVSDPHADFVDLTILRLGLSGQRREVAEATRWLDEQERELLSLWWLETVGRLTRGELVAAMGLSPQHTAVRVQRMKEQLEVGRMVVRALCADPRCSELSELTSGWDGRPAALWRKRIARHARTCTLCSGHRRGLVPVEGLLAGLALVPPPSHLTAFAQLPHPVHPVHHPVHPVHPGHASHPGQASHPANASSPSHTTHPSHAGHATHAGHLTQNPGAAHPAPPRRPHGRRRGVRRPVQVAGGLALTAAVLGLGYSFLGAGPAPGPDAARSAQQPPAASTAPPPPPTPTAVATTAPPATHPAAAGPSRSAVPSSLEQQLIELINVRRSSSGCAPLRIDPRLHRAAQGHSDSMVAGNYFDHVDPQGGNADSRITAAGYQWSMWGENLDQGTRSPATVVRDWMDGAIHQQNLLNCQYTDAGVGTAADSGGLVWTLDLGRPG